MPTASFNNHSVTTNWIDITVSQPALANADLLVQNINSLAVYVFWGGATAPTGKTGLLLGPEDSVRGAAANVWVSGSPGLIALETR